MNRDNYYDFLGYGRRGEETAYDKVILTSPGIKVEPISFSDYDTATLEGLLENTGDRDTSTVYVQATGFNEDGLPIFETVVLHGQPIPAGEKMRLSGHLYSTNPSFLDGSIGDFSDIVSWRFVVAAMTLVTPGLQG